MSQRRIQHPTTALGAGIPDGDFQILGNIFEQRLARAGTDASGSGPNSEERAALLGKFGALLRRLSALMRITDKEGEALSLDVVLVRLMAIVTDALDADRSSLFLYDQETGELFSRIAQGDLIDEIRVPSELGIAGWVFTNGEPVILHDAYRDPRFNAEIDGETGYTTYSILCVPVRNWDNKIIGVTQVLNKFNGQFDYEDCALLDALTSHASSALESMQLYDSVQKALRDEAQLLGITTALSSELHLDTLLGKIMSITTDVLEADRSTLFLHDPNTNVLWSKVAEGIETNEIRFPVSTGIAGSVFTSGESINIADAYADDRFNPEVDRSTGYKTRSILCVPVVTNSGRVIGVTQVLNKKGGPFGPRDEKRLRALASQAAIAIENARLFEDVLNAKNYSESILKSLSNGVITLDSSRLVIKVNEAALRILQVSEDMLLNQPFETLCQEGNDWILKKLDKVDKRRRSNLTLDADIKLADDRSVSVNLNIEPLIDVKDEPIGFMLIFEDVTAEKRVKSTMARYMDRELVDRLLQDDTAMLGGTAQEATVLFSDIRSFTQMSERLGARETVSVLNDYFSEMVEVVFEHAGLLDKYIGDAIMAVFGTPFTSAEDTDNAVGAAVQMRSALREFNRRRMLLGEAPIDVRIGINTGEVVSGNIGSPKRMDYTVIGDSVNLASRLEAANKLYGTNILISDHTRRRLSRERPLRELDLIRVKGRQQPVAVYEVLDEVQQSKPHLEQLLAVFVEGLAAYRARNWIQGITKFGKALELNPTDGPSRLYLERCAHYQNSPPLDEWNGVWTLTEK